MNAARARDVATASVPGRICLAGESLDWMTGGNSVTAAVPLRTRVTAWRADGSDALALISGPPLYQTRLVPAARAAASVYDGDVLDHMQAAARITLPAAADLAGVVVTASTDLPGRRRGVLQRRPDPRRGRGPVRLAARGRARHR